ncbi:MAG: oxidoreductase [Bacteroidales bacterium]|nr:oxidoreductase [Bacteroidales bacterium]
MSKTFQYISSVIFGIAVFLFWYLLYPHALGFQEQNQLFLFTWDFFVERMSVSGGLADYIAEFFTQFSYIPVLGEVLTALLFVAFQLSVALAVGRKEWYVLSFVAPMLLLVYMCDIYVMLSFLVALTVAVLLCALYRRRPGIIWAGIATVLGYWLIGPAIFVFAIYVPVRERNCKSLLVTLAAALAVAVSKFTYLQQYPWKTVISGINYYRMALTVPAMQIAVTAAALIPAFTDYLSKPKTMTNVVLGLLIAAGGVLDCSLSYKKDVVELIAYDQLVRHEDWDGVLKRAEKYQPESELGSVSVNLALFMSGRGNELPQFKQFGTRGLILPNIRDFISNASSSEVFWRLGMINESLRYAFDTQESLINNRKSGRWMSRMAECQILNGRYDVAEKYLDILSHSLFYRRWAENERQYLRNDAAIASNPIYAYLRSVRNQSDFLYYYPEMDKMLAILYHQNRNNVMAAWYYQAWTALKKNEADDEETYTGNAHGN